MPSRISASSAASSCAQPWSSFGTRNEPASKLQVGHAPQDVEERHYLDLVDAKESSQAVWDVLNGTRSLDGTSRVVEVKAVVPYTKNLQNVDYGGDYETKNKPATTNFNSIPSTQALYLMNDMKMKGVGIEPTTNGLKGFEYRLLCAWFL